MNHKSWVGATSEVINFFTIVCLLWAAMTSHNGLLVFMCWVAGVFQLAARVVYQAIMNARKMYKVADDE